MSRGGLDSLGRAWINAEAAKPHGYQVVGLMRQDYLEAIFDDRSEWIAQADGPGGLIWGGGASPEIALNELAAKLRAAGSGGAVE